MTSGLATSPAIYDLAKQLGLPTRGDVIAHFRDHVQRTVGDSLRITPVSESRSLLRLLAAHLSVQLEFIRSDEDVTHLASEYARIDGTFARQMHDQFMVRRVIGWLVENIRAQPGDRRFVAFVDARAARSAQSYFTAFHELVHIILTPTQRSFKGFERKEWTVVAKDPLEILVDTLTADIAFYEPIFAPHVQRTVNRQVTLLNIETIRLSAVPDASYLSTALAVVEHAKCPAGFVVGQISHKTSEKRLLNGPQQVLPMEITTPEAVLRLTTAKFNAAARRSGIEIFRQIRVPKDSVIMAAFGDIECGTHIDREDQGMWVASQKSLRSMSIVVEAQRRGDVVYAIIQPAHN